MTIFTDGLRVEPENRGVTDYTASIGDSLAATVSDTISDSPTAQLLGIGELEAAKGNDLSRMSGVDDALTFGGAPAPAPVVPTIGKLEAAERVKAAGLDRDLKLPDQDTIAVPALDIMINRARDRRERDATIQRGPQGFLPSAAAVGTSFLVGAVDPLNLASAFIPVMGELRYGKLLAGAGESFAGRTAVRMGVGAAEGAVGQAALEPLDWYAHTQEGRDFGMADVLHNLVFGAALGGGLHAIGGGARDLYRSRKGLAQYPFGPGEPMEHVDGVHVPESVLAEAGVAHEDMPAHLQPVLGTIDQVLAESPAMAALRDLPPRAHEDSMRAALANIIDGEPVKVGELLEAAAQTDPRIAESFEAWHGSPHQFDRFDISHLGNGEGAQSYGHGLYFAENEKVARGYQRTTSDKVFIDKVATLYDEGVRPTDAWNEVKDNWKDFTAPEQRLMTALEKDDWLGFDYPHQAVTAALRDPKGKRWEMSPETLEAIKGVGNMYKVRIKADPAHFLDWDKPLPEQHEHVRNALLNHPDPSVAGTAEKHGAVNGATLHARLKSRADGGQADVSKLLSQAGIPGIKYLDQGSRIRTIGDAHEVRIKQIETALQEHPSDGSAADTARVAKLQRELQELQGPGTRNFVVFDDKHVEIVDRNGEPVAKPFTEAAPGNNKITLGAPAPSERPPSNPPRSKAHPDTRSLNEHLASQGGLRPDPELATIYGNSRGPFVPGFGPLIRKTGMSIDDALSSAKQHGYMFDPHDVDNGTAGAGGRTGLGLTPRDLLDHLDNENRGQKLYKPGHLEATKYDPEQEKHVIMGHLEQELEASGAKVSDIDPHLLDRTVEIVHREGERDVLAAYERAIMEDEERYHAIAAARDTADQHASRDVPYDGGPAPAGSGADPLAGGPARRAGPEAGRADGAQSPGGGGGDRRPSDAAFRDLARTRGDVDDAAVVEASRTADHLREQVETSLDKRVTAAEKADAYAKQMYDMFKERLPAEERQRLDDMIASIDSDAAVRKEAIERSGACLFGARA